MFQNKEKGALREYINLTENKDYYCDEKDISDEKNFEDKEKDIKKGLFDKLKNLSI